MLFLLHTLQVFFEKRITLTKEVTQNHLYKCHCIGNANFMVSLLPYAIIFVNIDFKSSTTRVSTVHHIYFKLNSVQLQVHPMRVPFSLNRQSNSSQLNK